MDQVMALFYDPFFSPKKDQEEDLQTCESLSPFYFLDLGES